MIMDASKKILKNEKGQAIFEFVIFLPFLIFIYTAFINISSAINGSINQQKATRGYFYRLALHDSKIPNRHNLDFYDSNGLTVAGMSSTGWRIKSIGDTQSFGTCYKFLSLFGNNNDEECDELRTGEISSNFVKVFTFYGLCANTYLDSPSGYYEESQFFLRTQAPDQCILK